MTCNLFSLEIVTKGRSIINMPVEGGNVFYLRLFAVTLTMVISDGRKKTRNECRLS